jgi:hypothetical protein
MNHSIAATEVCHLPPCLIEGTLRRVHQRSHVCSVANWESDFVELNTSATGLRVSRSSSGSLFFVIVFMNFLTWRNSTPSSTSQRLHLTKFDQGSVVFPRGRDIGMAEKLRGCLDPVVQNHFTPILCA